MDTSVASIVINAVLKLMVMGVIGFVAAKLGCLNEQRTSALSKVLADIILPLMVFNSFLIKYDPAKNAGYFYVLLWAVVLNFAIMIPATLIFPKKGNPEWATDRNSAIISNAGFVGIPLFTLMGLTESLFYLSAYVLVANALLWTYTVLCYKDEFSKDSIKQLFKSPTIIAIILGLIVYFCRIPIPSLISGPAASTGACCGPIAMFVTGAILSRTDMLSVLKKKNTYIALALKLAVQPLLAVLITKMFAGPEGAMLALVVAAGCPVLTLCPVLAMQYGKDEKYAAGVLSASMVLCMATIPMAVAIYSMF